jgi:hypothetical protein
VRSQKKSIPYQQSLNSGFIFSSDKTHLPVRRRNAEIVTNKRRLFVNKALGDWLFTPVFFPGPFVILPGRKRTGLHPLDMSYLQSVACTGPFYRAAGVYAGVNTVACYWSAALDLGYDAVRHKNLYHIQFTYRRSDSRTDRAQPGWIRPSKLAVCHGMVPYSAAGMPYGDVGLLEHKHRTLRLPWMGDDIHELLDILGTYHSRGGNSVVERWKGSH